MKNLLKRVLLIMAIVAVAAVPVVSANATGDDVKNRILKKAYARQLYWCYKEDKILNSDIRMADSVNFLGKAQDVITGGFISVLTKGDTGVAGSGGTTRYLPNSLAPSDTTTCRNIIEKAVSDKGESFPSLGDSVEVRSNFLKKFGYKCKTDNATSTTNCSLDYGNVDEAIKTALNSWYSFPSITSLQYTDAEILVLYQGYLEGVYGAKIKCGDEAKGGDGWYDIKYADANSASGDGYTVRDDCKAKAGNAGTEVNGLAQPSSHGGSKYFMKSAKSNFEDVCGTLRNLSLSSISSDQMDAINSITGGASGYDADKGINTGAGTENGENNEGEEQDLCFNTADAIGWILCPIIKTTSGALDGAYDEFIKPLLQVSPQVVQALTLDNSSGIYQAWAIFRDIANVVFVILFLVVIFSQVTGYGIDNYGIKRMLPRLIVGAILVNFSFLICQLVVDMSNIVGASLQELLMGVGRGITIEGGDSSSIGGLFSIVLGAIGVGAAAAGAVIVATSVLPALSLGSLLSIAITIISALVAIFFGMVLLGARQAIIVLLVVTSPVAFVLYLLPNTQAYFRRWTGIFSRLLLVYPAAGLLIGGGYLAAKILLSVNGGFIMNLVGLVMLVIPYFLIIPLVRSSMNTISGLGGRLQAYSRGARGRVNGVRNSEAYKRTATNLAGQNMERRAQALQRRQNRSSRFRRIPVVGGAMARINDLAGQNAAVELGRQADIKTKQDRQELEAAIEMDELANGVQSSPDLRNRALEALEDGDESRYTMLMTRLSKQDSKTAADFLTSQLNDMDDVATNEEKQGRLQILRKQFSNDKDLQARLKQRDKTAFDMMNDVGKYNNLSYADYGKDQTIEDRMTQSGAALTRDMKNGKLTEQTVNDMLNSTDSRVISGINSDPGKRSIMQSFSQHMANNAGMADAYRSFGGASNTLVQEYNNRANVAQVQATESANLARDEEDAFRRGKVNLEFNGSAVLNNDGSTVSGFAVPSGFKANGLAKTKNGDYVYVEQGANGENRYWNANTGKYENENVLNDVDSNDMISV